MSYPDYLGAPAELPGRGESPRPARIRDWPHAEWLAVGAVCFGAITSSLDNGVITVAYPKLQHALHLSLSQTAWLVLISLLTVVATLVLFGRRADYVGRKRVYIDGFVIFIAGAIACAASQGYWMLLGARVVEGLGVAMIQANSVALVASSVRERHRTTALGVQASAQAAGLATGPLIGGLLVPHVSWREVFLISVPLAALALVSSIFFLPRSRTSVKAPKLNIAGAAVLALAAGGLIGGLTLGAKSGWNGPALGFVAIGVVACAALVPVEKRAPSPLFEPRIMRVVTARRALISIAITWVTFFGLLTTIPFYVERQLGGSLAMGGAITMAIPVGLIVMAPLMGFIRRHLSRRTIALSAASAVLLALAPARLDRNELVLVALLFVIGAGVGASNTLNSTAVMEGVLDSDRGVASSLVNLARALGSAIGVATASSLIEASHARSATGAFIALTVSALVSWTAALFVQSDRQP